LSNIKLALEVVENLKSLAESIEDLVNNMQGTSLEKEAMDTEPLNAAIEAEPKKELTIETVRAALALKTQAGKQAEIKALIASYGAGKLTDLDPKYYDELVSKAEVL